ncbi:RHS repeat-associated core domain-containing protein [Sphingobacterium sp.]|uniref:RHS repeat-associated core domain-containing protein n=1 Tax=Sphingobacterium sp. TaxID=341027 RepID=UPI00289E9CA0|nr:RHS repeat-associated core domain-containing protein [Sphingobacterium sp.]
MNSYFKYNIVSAAALLMAALFTLPARAQSTYPMLDQTKVPGTNTRFVSLPPDLITSDYNSTRTFVPKIRITDASQVNDNSNPEQVGISTTYSNGLGATIQTVQQHATRTANGEYRHMVMPNDIRTRADGYSFMAYPSPIKDYNHAAVNRSVEYHNSSRYPSEGGITDEAVISTGQQLNSSNSTERSFTAYDPGKSRMGQGRGTKVTLITNKTSGPQNAPAAHVRQWSLNASGIPLSTGVFAAGILRGSRTETADGMEKYVLSDQNDNPLYEANLLTTPGGVKEYGVTYYIYDELDRLRYTLPPKAVAAISVAGWAVSQQILDELCFSYLYDAEGRQHSLHKPGEQGYTELVYRKDGQLIMRRSPLEKQKGLWELVFYDQSNRVIATGLLSNNNDRAYWQAQANAQSAQAASSAFYYIWGAGKGQHPPKTGLTATEMLTYNYYDQYPATVLASETYNPSLFQPLLVPGSTADVPAARASVFGFLAASEVKVINNPGLTTNLQDWTNAKNYYDYYGRSIYSVGQNATGAKDSVYQQYNVAGQPLKKWHLRNAMIGGVVRRTTELETFNYEAYSGRLTGISRSTNGGTNEPAVSYTYDELGRMVKEVLGEDAETRLYTYNVRGELLGINEDYALTGNRAGYTMTFGEALRYDHGFAYPRYDGLVSGMIWRGSGGTAVKAHSYTYRYDSAGRMTSARYYEAATTGGVPASWTNTQRNYSQTVAYDVNSNILSAQRFGVSQHPSYTGVFQVDQLTYNYLPNSNKLDKVLDGVPIDYRTGDYQPGTAQGYSYDVSGNLTEDKSKNITAVTYTWFNKPQQVSFADGGTIRYSYDAGGSKLQEVVATTSQTKYTTYISGAVYKDTSLTYITTAQGRTNMTTSPPRQEYFVKDHLDNVRSTVASANPIVLDYAVSYELAYATQEEALFENVAEIRKDKPGSTSDIDRKAGLLPDNRQVGTSILLKVMAGDKLDINTDNFYETFNSNNSAEDQTPAETIFENALNSLAGGNNAINGGEGASPGAIINRMLSNPEAARAYIDLVDASTDENRPGAFLNFLFFDEEMKLMPEHSHLWQAAGENNWSPIGTDPSTALEMPLNGHVIVYLSNHTQIANWFDNLNISLQKGILLEETHYYAYGLPIAGLNSQASTATKQRQRYQDNEYIEELGLKWMDFHNRSYDPQLGRFLSPDPLADEGGQQILSPFHAMGCDPVNMVDPLGLQSALPGSWQAGQPTMRDLAYLIPPSLLADYDFNSQHIFNATDRIKERMLEDALTGYLGFVFEQWSKNYGGLTFANGQLYIHSNTVTEGNDRGVEYSFNSSGRKVYYEGLNNRVVTGTTTVFNLGVGLGYVAPPSLYQEHVDDFEGFFGKINYIFSDGIAHGAYYDWDGNYVRPAPMTGMPPDVGIGRIGNTVKLVSNAKRGLTNAELVQKSATLAERAIGGKGGVAGTAKHNYAKNLLSRYQQRYGDRGLGLGSNYFNGPAGKGFLDVVDHSSKMIYDFKFGNAVMSNAQYLKYSNSFPGYGIRIIRP